MSKTTKSYDVYLETGQKRVFAVAVKWPGWGRSGKDEAAAFQALVESASRYAKIARIAQIEFLVPEDSSSFDIVHRLKGNATTDFGAPDKPLPNDWNPIGDQELERIKKLLTACWLAFDEAVKKGEGKELRKAREVAGVT